MPYILSIQFSTMVFVLAMALFGGTIGASLWRYRKTPTTTPKLSNTCVERYGNEVFMTNRTHVVANWCCGVDHTLTEDYPYDIGGSE